MTFPNRDYLPEERKWIHFRLAIVIALCLWATLIFVALINNESSDQRALRVEYEALEYCNKQNYPVDLNLREWRECLRDHGLLP